MARKAKQKQPNGAGNVRKRADGRWMARVWMVEAITGERKRYTYYGATEQEARGKMEDAKVATRRGDSLAAGDRPTLKTYGEHWLKLRTEAPDARPRVVGRYREILEHHIFPTLGGTKINELDAAQIKALMRAKREGAAGKKPLAPRTCNHIRAVLRSLLNDAIEATDGHGRSRYGLTVNAAKVAEPEKVRRDGKPKAFTAPQSRQLLELARTHPDGAIWTLALTTGLRQSELLGLRWADINDLDDCANASVTIRKTVQRTKGTWLVQDPKSDAGARVVPLTAIGCDALQRQRAEQREARLHAGKKWKVPTDSRGQPIADLVFTTGFGQPRQGSVITHRFMDALKDAKLPLSVKFHGLRHSTGTLLHALHVPAVVAMEILGHADIHTTLQIYTEGGEDARREAMTAVNAALSG